MMEIGELKILVFDPPLRWISSRFQIIHRHKVLAEGRGPEAYTVAANAVVSVLEKNGLQTDADLLRQSLTR